MADENTQLRLGDIPGLTAEQKAGLEAGLNGVYRAVLDGINPHIKTEAEIDALVQRALNMQLAAQLPTDEASREAAKLKLRDTYIRTLIGPETDRKRAIAEWESAELTKLRTTVASLTSGSTTYSNVTPTLIYNEILDYAKTLFWHRQECRVLTGSPKSGVFPVGASTRVTAYRRTEGDDHSASTPQMSGHAFTKLPLSASVKVANELIEWGIPVLYQWLVSELGYAFGIKEFTEFQTGNDSGVWNGIENASITAVAQPGTDEMDGIKKLFRTLPRVFRPQAVFWASGNTIAAIESLKTSQGTPYFNQPGPLDTLCGKRLLECEVATDGNLYFGWLNRYHIYDGDSNGGSTMEGATLASANCTMLYMHTSNDGGPADVNAFRSTTITV